MASGRQTLTMAITLEGADKVTTDLSKLGPAAEKAFGEIQKAAERAGVGLDKRLGLAIVAIRTKLAALQAAGARLGQSFNTFTLAVDTFGKSILISAKRIAILTTAISGAAGAFIFFAKSSSANAERIKNQADALGFTVEAYQNIENAAKSAGVEQGVLDAILQKFAVNAAEAGTSASEAADGTNKLKRELRDVQITAEDGSKKIIKISGTSADFAKHLKTVGAAAKGSEKDLLNFAKKIEGLSTAQLRLKAVLDAGFSKRQATATVTFFRALAQGADEASRAAAKLIEPLSDVEIAVGIDLDNAFDRFGTNLQRTKDRLFTLFGPTLTEAVNRFADLIFDNKAVIEEWAAFIRDKAIEIVKDFFNALSGNDADVKNQWVLDFRDGAIAVGTAIKDLAIGVKDAFVGIRDKLEEFTTWFNATFGTDIKANVLIAGGAIFVFLGGLQLLGATLAVAAASIQLFSSALGLLAIPLGSVALGVIGVIAAIVALSSFMADLTSTPFPIALWITAGLAGSSTVVFLYWEDFKKMATDALDFINQKFEERPFSERFKAAALAPFEALWTLIKLGASGAFSALEGIAERVINRIISLVRSAVDAVKDLIAAFRSATAAKESAGESGGGGGFAHGGPIRGSGSATSDSIPIWASDGEFMMSARAVRKWGVGFFEALNGLRMPKGGFRFNMGGLVHAMAPRYASGGPVAEPAVQAGQGRALVFNIGGENYEVMATDNVVNRLMKAAIGKQIRSNGRKPAWFAT